ncbi:MAG: ABC transporter permease [Parvularculales bacterium]
MRAFAAIFRREFRAYFTTPLALVFIVIFLVSIGASTFYLGGFLESGMVSPAPFFVFHPWLYLFFAPAIAMRLWAEERRTGVIELLFTLPVPLWSAVLGKFFAAWLFLSLTLAFTFPFWITLNVLGNPDNGVVLAGYLGSLLMAGGYLAISACMSALTRNQPVAFITGVIVCFAFMVSSLPVVLDLFQGWAPQIILTTIASFSLLTHFDDISKGVIDARDIVFFVSLIVVWLAGSMVVLNMKRTSV